MPATVDLQFPLTCIDNEGQCPVFDVLEGAGCLVASACQVQTRCGRLNDEKRRQLPPDRFLVARLGLD